MPPWHAEGEHGTFANDQRLNAIDKSTILRWSDGGAPKGDDALKPASPKTSGYSRSSSCQARAK